MYTGHARFVIFLPCTVPKWLTDSNAIHTYIHAYYSSSGCRYFIEVAHVALVPGDAFGAPQCIRISYAASLETLKKAMDRIEKALDPSVYTRRQQ